MKSILSTLYSTKISPNANIRKNAAYNPSGIPCKISIHHTAGCLNPEYYANSFMSPYRKGSSNYIISDDTILCVIPEEYRAWTSGSRENDYLAITIEVCNSTGAPSWMISDKSYKSLIALCIDICKRYNIIPVFTGDKKGTFTYHYMFEATLCPGPYIKSLTDRIIKDVTAGLSIPQDATVKPSPATDTDKSYLVKVTASDLNIRSGPSTKYKAVGHITDHGVYTIVETNGNWGRLKSGAGWICLRYTKEVK